MYVLSDLHLGHANIIDYCSRPFPNVATMNKVLIDNWNTAINPDDTVVYLGDLSMSDDIGRLLDWVDRLNGDIQFVIGDHDTVVPPNLPETAIHSTYRFTYRGVPFFAVHDPAEGPGNFAGWVLHGHHHNNHPELFPFVNPEERRVNVSVELLQYRPLHLDELIKYLQEMAWLDERPANTNLGEGNTRV